jgi:hypothetical protein
MSQDVPLRLPSATGNRLILSVDGAKRYYMFLLVERSLDHFACRINLLDANKRRVPGTYQKYVMDPMFQHQ